MKGHPAQGYCASSSTFQIQGSVAEALRRNVRKSVEKLPRTVEFVIDQGQGRLGIFLV